jgi:hypothetical protein
MLGCGAFPYPKDLESRPCLRAEEGGAGGPRGVGCTVTLLLRPGRSFRLIHSSWPSERTHCEN